MATSTQTVLAQPKPSVWFQEFLKEELAPYPGRAGTAARMVIAATLVMVICMTFQIGYAFQGAVYALIISRENLRVTLQSAGASVLVTVISAAYLLISAWFVISVPTLHFLWIIVSFFVAFYAFSTINNYAAAAIFAFTIAIGVPLWDRHLSAETGVEDTLRVVLASSIGVVVTAAIELAFASTKPGDGIVLPIAERLAAVASLLACYAEARPRMAQQEFDDNLAKMLDGMADRIVGRATQERDQFEDSFKRLEQTIQTCYSEGPQELPTKELRTFLALSRSIETVTISLDKQI